MQQEERAGFGDEVEAEVKRAVEAEYEIEFKPKKNRLSVGYSIMFCGDIKISVGTDGRIRTFSGEKVSGEYEVPVGTFIVLNIGVLGEVEISRIK